MNHDIHNHDIVINNHGRRRRGPLCYLFVPDKPQRRKQRRRRRRRRRRKALPLGQKQH